MIQGAAVAELASARACLLSPYIFSPKPKWGRWVQSFQIVKKIYTDQLLTSAVTHQSVSQSLSQSASHSVAHSAATMDFIGEVVSEVIGNRRDEAPMDPPYVQPPWVTRWDGEAGRWIFINEATGERSWERPVLEEAGKQLERTTRINTALKTD